MPTDSQTLHFFHTVWCDLSKQMLPYEGGQFIKLLGAPGHKFNLFLAAAIGCSTQEETQSFCYVCLKKNNKKYKITFLLLAPN